MGKRFTKKFIDNKIIFTDIEYNKTVKIKHYDDPNSFDILRINNDLDKKFVNYIISELQGTNDICSCEILYYDKLIEDVLHNNGFKVSNYNYLIPYKNYPLSKNLVSSGNIDDESKKYYLDMLNKKIGENSKYYSKNIKHIGEKYFENTEFEYLVYKINNKIVGIVDFQNFNYISPNNNIDELYDYSNKLAIRNLFADTIEMRVEILKDLLNKYNKDIIIGHLYTDNDLKEAIKKVGGKFKYAMYTSIKYIM